MFCWSPPRLLFSVVRVVFLLALGLCGAISVAAQTPRDAMLTNGDDVTYEKGGAVAAAAEVAARRLLSMVPADSNDRLHKKRRVDVQHEMSARGLSAGELATVDLASVFNAESGELFELVMPDRGTVFIRTEKVISTVSGAQVWQGVVLNTRLPKRAYITRLGDAVHGLIDTDETLVELHGVPPSLENSATNEKTVYSIDFAKAGLSRAFSFANDAIAPPAFEDRPAAIQAETLARLAEEVSSKRQMAEKAAPSPQSTIDLMVAYTAGMVTRYGSAAGVVTRLETLVAYANTAYTNSDVAITLRLVHSTQVSYTDAGANTSAILNELTSPPSGSSLAGLPALRDTYGADLVALVRSYASTHAGCGIGWVGGYNVSNISGYASYGFSLVSDGNSASDGGNTYCPLGTLAHELGHNMGLNHDRANAGSDFGATRYAYGYTLPSTSIGDVMSYASTEFQGFSNPSLFCSGTTCSINGAGTAAGVAADTPVEACIATAGGCTAAQASSCTANATTCADAARALNFTRAKVAAFRATVVPNPITISGTATISGGGNVTNGTTLCANPATGVTCGTTSSGAYSCTVPSGWTGTLHLQAGNSNRVAAKRFTAGVTTSQASQNFSVSASTAFACNLDIDNDGLNNAQVDGVALLRRWAGMTGASSAVASTQACAQRTSAADMASYAAGRSYDVDGSGNGFSTAREGLVLLRLMLGMSGAQAVTGTGLSWNTTLQSQINTACGTSF